MIGDRMRQARLAAGLTLAEVAERLETAGQPITRQGISKYEHNRSMPRSLVSAETGAGAWGQVGVFLGRARPTHRVAGVPQRCDALPHAPGTDQGAGEDVAEGQYDLWLTLYPTGNRSFHRSAPSARSMTPRPQRSNCAKPGGWATRPSRVSRRASKITVVSLLAGQTMRGHSTDWPPGSISRAAHRHHTSVTPDRRRFNLAHEMEHLLSDVRGRCVG